MLKREDAKRVERIRYSRGDPTKVYIYDCLGDCGKEIRVQTPALKVRTGYCVRCVKRKGIDPYRRIYNGLLGRAERGGYECTITYDEFEFFTNIRCCSYCGGYLKWNKYSSGPYNLDRKDSDIGYTLENVVLCCHKCNFQKNNFYSFDEYKAISELLKVWRQASPTEQQELMLMLVSWNDKFELVS